MFDSISINEFQEHCDNIRALLSNHRQIIQKHSPLYLEAQDKAEVSESNLKTFLEGSSKIRNIPI